MEHDMRPKNAIYADGKRAIGGFKKLNLSKDQQEEESQDQKKKQGRRPRL